MHQKGNRSQSHPWVVFGVIAGCYLFVYFHRVSTSVIAPDLLEAFQTNATALGFMSSMYFYLYALEQPIVGYLSDRLGPRRVVAYWSLLAGAATILFGLAPSIGWASVWRAVIGFGVGGVYVPALKAFSQWFKVRQFSTMTGLLLAVGNLGAIVATTPLAWMARTWGWRNAFFVIGAATFCLAFAVLILIKDFSPSKTPSTRKPEAPLPMDSNEAPSAIGVLMSLRFWVLAIIFAGFFGTFLTFQGLWATPYLVSIYAMDQMRASGLNMLVPIGFMVGAPVFGRLADRLFQDKANMLITTLALESAIWGVLTFGWQVTGPSAMGVALFLMGAIAGGFITALWALVNETTSREILGTVSGLLNTSPFLGVAAMQVITGYLLDRSGQVNGTYPPEAFQAALLACLLVMSACLALCTGFKKALSS
ncbi:MAG: MFS transporter [Deltaproteobacteria bacterium]|nr:MFS transporter [Deltaproteobacteria bacterium]